MVIQCWSSQFLAGTTTLPLNVAPACNWTTSPQEACERARSTLSPACTIQVFPSERVSAKELFTDSLGNSAGPSKLPVAATAKPSCVLPEEKETSSPKRRNKFEKVIVPLPIPTLRAPGENFGEEISRTLQFN